MKLFGKQQDKFILRLCIDNVTTLEYTRYMNTTLQIRIDKKTKEKARKTFESMGLDLSSGVKYLLTQIGNSDSLSYICDFGYKHTYTPEMMKKYKKENAHAIKYGKRFSTVKELFDDLEK